METRGAKRCVAYSLSRCKPLCDLVIKEEPFSLWRDFGSPNQGISSLKSDFQGFPGGSVVKNLPANAGQTDSIPHLGRSHMPQSN